MRHLGGPDAPGERPARMMRPMGAAEPMQGIFTGSEMSKLKDVLLLVVCALSRNAFDEQIARHMMEGKPLEPGEIQHILDETGRVQNIPEGHHAVLKKAHEWLQKQAAGGGQPGA